MKPIGTVPRARPVRALARARVHTGTLGELVQALAAGRRFWLLPLLAVLGLSALLLVVVAALEYVAPFVYTIF
jgi:hypothetical protein